MGWLLIILWLVIATLWGLFALRKQILIYGRKNLKICFILNWVGWPIAMGIALYNHIKRE